MHIIRKSWYSSRDAQKTTVDFGRHWLWYANLVRLRLPNLGPSFILPVSPFQDTQSDQIGPFFPVKIYILTGKFKHRFVCDGWPILTNGKWMLMDVAKQITCLLIVNTQRGRETWNEKNFSRFLDGATRMALMRALKWAPTWYVSADFPTFISYPDLIKRLAIKGISGVSWDISSGGSF